MQSPTKESLGAEVIFDAAGHNGAPEACVWAQAGDPVEVVRGVFRNELRVLEQSEYRQGRPIAGLCLDVASTREQVRQAYSQEFTGWQRMIAGSFEAAGLPASRASSVAAFVLSSLEGAIILSRVHRSTTPLRDAGRLVGDALEAVLAQHRGSQVSD